MTTTAAFPRTQHWTTGRDGFRISVLLYKTSRHACATCGKRPAMHYVSANGKGSLQGFSAHAHFCDEHRPSRGTLPPLEYKRLVAGGAVVVYEYLAPFPEFACVACGDPAVFEVREQCLGCDDPGRQATTRRTEIRPGRVTTYPAERAHVRHDTRVWWACAAHSPSAPKPPAALEAT